MRFTGSHDLRERRLKSFGQLFAIRQSCLIALATSVGGGTLT